MFLYLITYKSIIIFCDYRFLPWQFLNFLPLPHGHGSVSYTHLQIEVVAVEISFAHLGIHGYTTIISNTFVSTRCEVEEGSLTAVWVPYQCHIDAAVESFCFLLKMCIRDSLKIDPNFGKKEEKEEDEAELDTIE